MRSSLNGLSLAFALLAGVCLNWPLVAQEAEAKKPEEAKPAAEAAEPKAEEPKAEEPKAEEPKAEEPKAEEPKAAEPKAAEPKADEPKAAEPKTAEPKEGDAPPKAEESGKGAAADHADAPKGEGHDHAEGGHDHAEGGHAGHDPYDNTHSNASATLSRADEMRFDLSIATFLVFALLSVILAKFAWGPIVSGLDKRESNIAKMIDDARLAQEQAEAQLRSYEAKLAAATEEARTMVAQARADAEAAKERIAAEAKEAAAKEREKAVEDINNAKNAALQQIAEKSVNTAITLASNIVRREVKPEDHDRLVSDALGQFSKLN